MENIMLLVLGIFISILGIVNIQGNISTIHSYSRRKVKEEDVIPYIVIPALLVGLIFMLYGQIKYNHGIF